VKPLASRWLRRLLVAAANLAVVLVLLEVALRVQEPFLRLMSRGDQGSPNYRFAVIDHPVWDHQLRPDLRDFWLRVSGRDGDPDFAYPLRTNAWGCRYGDISVPRPPDRRRVVVMGDSFTEGYAEEDTVAWHLEQALDAAGAGVDFEVMNCGVSSYSLLPIRLRLRDQLLATGPDAVIVNVDLTDPYDDWWRRRPDLRVDARGRAIGVGSEPEGALRGLAERHSYAVRALSAYGRLAERLVKQMLRGGDAAGAPPLDTLADRYRMHGPGPEAAREFEAAFAFFAEQLDALIALCHDARLACAVSTYPHAAQLARGGEPPRLHRELQMRLAAHLAARGVFFHDATPAIAAAYARDPAIYRRGDMHFSPAGQRAWARDFAAAFAPWVVAQAAGAAAAHQQMPE
jgi:lysophospholipase L1-like esterase